MSARRFFRALTRPFKRLARPVRLRWIAYKIKCSDDAIERLRDLRAATIELEQIECKHQVQLAVRKVELELS